MVIKCESSFHNKLTYSFIAALVQEETPIFLITPLYGSPPPLCLLQSQRCTMAECSGHLVFKWTGGSAVETGHWTSASARVDNDNEVLDCPKQS